MVIGLALGNSFDTLIGPLIFSSVKLEFITLIITLMGSLIGNYMVRSIEAFIGFPLYFYFFTCRRLV